MAGPTNRRPAGARSNAGKAPFRPEVSRAVRKPELPKVAPKLPKRVLTEIRNQAKGKALADEVAVALTVAGEAIDEGVPEEGLPYLEWAKSALPRSVSVREALGIARYHAGEYQQALNELRAYKRLSGARDQCHVIADCMRAVGQPTSAVAAEVEELLADDHVPAERRVEGLIVWAMAVADGGDAEGGRAVLRRADRSLLRAAGEEAQERHRYVVGELATRAGDVAAARAAWEALAELPGDPYELAERLAELG